MSHESDGLILVFVLFLISLVFVWEYHIKSVSSSVFAVVLGMLVSTIWKTYSPMPLTFASELFLYLLLPPILLNSALSFHVKSLRTNWVSSLSHACLGTIFAMLWIAWGNLVWTSGTSVQMTVAESFLFAAVLAPTDTVATIAMTRSLQKCSHQGKYLLQVLENESIMNDALSVVFVRLFRTMVVSDRTLDRWLPFEIIGWSLFSTAAAVAIGVVMAKGMRRFKVVSLTSHYMMALFVYAACECVGISGILSIFAYGSISNPPKAFAESVSSLSAIIEAYVYLMLGLAVHTYDTSMFGLSLLIFVSCVAGRLLAVFGLGICLRLSGQRHWHVRSMLLFSMCGVRGAISYALCQTLDSDFMKSTTFVVIMGTILIFGTLQKCIFKMLL